MAWKYQFTFFNAKLILYNLPQLLSIYPVIINADKIGTVSHPCALDAVDVWAPPSDAISDLFSAITCKSACTTIAKKLNPDEWSVVLHRGSTFQPFFPVFPAGYSLASVLPPGAPDDREVGWGGNMRLVFFRYLYPRDFHPSVVHLA